MMAVAINYLAEGTQDSVKTAVRAMAEVVQEAQEESEIGLN